MVKTNAARILDKLKIKYSLQEYPVDEEDLSAVHVAATIGIPVETIYKTLVLKGDNTGFLVAVIPGDKEVDLKKIAQASGNKRCELIPMKDLQQITGYIRGGCSPIGMKKQFPTILDSEAITHPYIYISAGKRGLQLKLAPEDLIKATAAVEVPISVN